MPRAVPGLAESGVTAGPAGCPLLRAIRTFNGPRPMAEIDPFRSLLSKYYCNAQGDFRFGRRLAHVLQWVETFRGALEGGVIFGFGLVWPGHAGVAIQNTR
jgi:hypothetical protein